MVSLSLKAWHVRDSCIQNSEICYKISLFVSKAQHQPQKKMRSLKLATSKLLSKFKQFTRILVSILTLLAERQ